MYEKYAVHDKRASETTWEDLESVWNVRKKDKISHWRVSKWIILSVMLEGYVHTELNSVSSNAVKAVVNEVWCAPLETAQADIDQSTYPLRVASVTNNQWSDDDDNDEESTSTARDGETPNDEAIPTVALRDV